MPRLFTAVLPAAGALDALRAGLGGAPAWPPSGWRAVPEPSWHVTMCFHGEAESGELSRRLASAARRWPAPLLRLAGAVRFPGVLAAGLETASAADAELLSELVACLGADPARFRGHLTLARAGRRTGLPGGTGWLERHRGPWWRPARLCLVRSELGDGPPRYILQESFPL